MKNLCDVRVGQIWQDWDVRFRNQTPVYKKIIKIEGEYAYCEGIKGNKIISRSRISLRRFRPNSTGYKLIKNNQPMQLEGDK
jgi:hypothetical protein